MSIVVYYYLETGKSRNFLGIQISKKNFFLSSLHNYSSNVMQCLKRENPLLQSPYFVFLKY